MKARMNRRGVQDASLRSLKVALAAPQRISWRSVCSQTRGMDLQVTINQGTSAGGMRFDVPLDMTFADAL
jgi:hypothetical protein